MDGMAAYDRGKKMIRNNLLYSYDQENNVISPIPASPYLIPAIIGYGLLWFVGLFFDSSKKYLLGVKEKITHTRGVDYETWKVYRDKYIYLIKKREDYGLTAAEIIELRTIQRPPWAQPDEIWTYKQD